MNQAIPYWKKLLFLVCAGRYYWCISAFFEEANVGLCALEYLLVAGNEHLVRFMCVCPASLMRNKLIYVHLNQFPFSQKA